MDRSQDVLDAVEARSHALGRRDPDALRRILHPDFRWTSHRGQTTTRDDYIANNTRSALVWLSQTFADVDLVIVDERTAVVAAVAHDTVSRDGVWQQFRMPVTQTWVRTGEVWRCLAGHAGPLLT